MSLRDHMQAIYEDRGKLTPEIVVEVARAKGHPLHDRFEWNDKLAGEAYRRQQAHELIQSVKVVYREDDRNGPQSVRAWHAVRNGDGEHVYEPADEVAADPLKARMLLAEMERDWKQLRRRYEHFEEFWRMVKGDGGQASEAA